MSQEGSAAGFDQASADAARLASELAEIRKQLTKLREENARFLATDPATGKGPPEASAPKESSKEQPVAKTIGANAKAGQAAAAANEAQTKSPGKEPQMATAARAGASASSGSKPATEQDSDEQASGPEAPAEEADSGKKRWWKKQKTDPKDIGF